MSNSSTPPTAEEIYAHLHELNLASDVKLKETRKEWFKQHKIKVRLVQGTFFLEPECSDPKTFLEHLYYANLYVVLLAEELKWFKEHKYVVKLEKHGTFKKYVFVEELPPEEQRSEAAPATLQKEDE